MRKEDINNAAEVVTFIGGWYGNRETFRAAMSEKLNIRVPKSLSYRQMAELVLKSNLEKEFCAAFLARSFGTTTFADTYDKYVVLGGLKLLGREEIISLAKALSSAGRKWEYDNRNKGNAVNALLANATRGEIESCVVGQMEKGRLGPFVRQSKHSLIGPMGTARSTASRGPEGEELQEILRNHIGRGLIDAYVGRDARLKEEFDVPVEDPLRLDKFIQLLFVSKKDSEILQTLNSLIEDRILDIAGVDLVTYFRFAVTPSGVFEKAYGEGTDRLSELIMSEIDSPLLERSLNPKYKGSSLQLRLLDKCIRENPEDVLQELFGRPQLLEIATSLGLVRISDLSNMELAKLVSMRLGFSLPPKLDGPAALIKKIADGRKRIQNPSADASARRGVAVEALQGIEQVLKELAYFHIACVWQDEVSEAYTVDRMTDRVNEIIKREFQMKRSGGLVKFTLGMLISLCRRVNELAASNETVRERIRRRFQREQPFPSDAIDLIAKADAFSPQIKHADRGGSTDDLDIDSCDVFLSHVLGAMEMFRKEGSYPRLIRVRKEIQDEYDRRYIIAVDEEGEEWTVKSDAWLQPEKAYLMHSETSPVAISPFIIERLY